ncbi:hypothetical protein [Nocardioides pacificus]
MSNNWAGRQGSRRLPPTPLEAAQEARAHLQEQFYRVDQLQRDIGTTVTSYAALLPDRARTTGVVPGWERLDEEAHAAILAYLDLLDRFDPLEESLLPQIQQATPAFAELTPRLGRLADELEDYLGRFGPELRRLGETRAQVRRRVDEAAAAAARAERAWRAMREGGHEFPAADEALARAALAARKLSEIAEHLTPEQADEPARTVERLAAEAERLSTELPQRAATLRNRIPSLATRIDAMTNRAASVSESMGQLRREFSLGNWRDIAEQERDVEAGLERARIELRDLDRLHRSGDVVGALGQLTKLEETLERTQTLVDGPRERLELLRSVRKEPQGLFERARFSVRDARYLVMRGRQVAPQPWGDRLDAIARELIDMESLLEPTHPDYLALHRRAEQLQERVRRLVDDFRASQ